MNMNKETIKKACVVALVTAIMTTALFSVYRILKERNGHGNASSNEFENITPPLFYTDEAVQGMVKLVPVDSNTYYRQRFEEKIDNWPEKDFSMIEEEGEGPWQYKIKDPDNYQDTLKPAVQRFWYYFENQEAFSEEAYESEPLYTTYETVYSSLLAGNEEEAVWGILWKTYAPDYSSLSTFQKGYASLLNNGEEYVYFSMAVHIRMVKPYIFEVAGIADLEQTMKAYEEKYEDADFSWFPLLYRGAGEITAFSNEQESFFAGPREYEYILSSKEEGMFLTMPAGEKISVPVEKEQLIDEGDPLTGAASSIRKESYQCDEKKIIFVYDGKEGEIFASYYDDGKWAESLVSDFYPYGIFKPFVIFPENGEEGYIFGVVDRVVFQETCVLFHTADGGKTWEEVNMSSNAFVHSLTMGFDFFTNHTGYMSIHSSFENLPNLLLTQDGGKTWENAAFDKVPEYFCQAYIPEKHGDKLVLFVGMEDYSEMGGEKAYYESEDDGKTWNYKGQVYRK